MGTEKPESKTDVLVKLVLVFFVCLLAFSVGTFVGKKFSDNQHRLSKYEPGVEATAVAEQEQKEAAESRDVASVHTAATEVKPDSQDELLKIAESFQKDGAIAPRQKPEVKENFAKGNVAEPTVSPEVKLGETPDPSKKAMSALDMKPLDPVQRIANNLPPEPEIVEPSQDSKIPSALPRDLASSPVGKYTVQVGSYSTEDEARKKASELKSRGFASFYIKAQVRDVASVTTRTWYRVSVGLYATPKEAEKMRKEILLQPQITSALVQRIAQ